MSSPLKITLKLTPPKPVDSPSRTSTPSSLKNSRDDDSSATESPRKRAKPNNGGRSRKPKMAVEGTPVPDTPVTVDEEGGEEGTPNTTTKRSGGGGGGNSAGGNQNSSGVAGNSSSSSSSTLITKKELLKYKDIKVRKWVSKPLTFYTLNGSEIQVASWQSDEKMTINKRTTEPITVTEIDQLFSSTSGEKDFRPFLCTQPGCSKAFTTFDQLQTHETNMHGTKKLVCGIDGCHKSFVTPGQLTKHRKMVHFRAARKAKMAAAAAAAAEAAAEAATTTANNESSMTTDEQGKKEEDDDDDNNSTTM